MFAEKINFLLVNQKKYFSVKTGFEELKKVNKLEGDPTGQLI